MIRARASETLLRDALLGESATAAAQPPVAALRALRRRRNQRRLSRAAAVTAAALCVCASAWWSLRRDIDRPATPSPVTPTWMVRTVDLTPARIVRTGVAGDVVRTPALMPPGLVVRTRPGLFSPLSDEALLALLAGQAPALIGAPGERRLVLRADAIAQ